MKRLQIIALLLLAVLATCTPKGDNGMVETRHGTSLQTMPSPVLTAVDSMMWQRPDSALVCLLPYFDTCCRDVSRNVSETENDGISGDVSGNVSTDYNHHYAHLLLSELLYKNDYAQTNRAELWQAVGYFDSLLMADACDASLRSCLRRDTPRESANAAAFLDARAHYINGVGYYERDSVVEACKEYLKALEVMESHFAENELVGTKAKFMTYTNNRLGDMFSEQFMLEPATTCFKNSYVFSLVSPISSYSVSNALYWIGKQFHKNGNIDSAYYYYLQSIDNMPDTTCLYYRDILSTQSLLSYQLTHQAEAPLKRLKQMVDWAKNDNEKLTRCFVIGGIYFEEGVYDSASFYLEPVFENNEDIVSQIQSAHYLHIIYDSLGENEKRDDCMRFLAQQKKSEGQNKTLVSRLDSQYQKYLSQKLYKQAKQEQNKAFLKATKTIIPIAAGDTLFIIVFAIQKRKKTLREQQEASVRVLEETEQQHRTEQAALYGRLKRSNQEVRELKDKIKRQDNAATNISSAASFGEEPVCRLIIERVNEGMFKSKVDYRVYKDYAINKQQLLDLRLAADRHFGQFTVRLKKAYPKLTNSDLDYCCLYLLGLTDADIAALMQRAYNTVVERNGKLKKTFGSDNPLSSTLMTFAKDCYLPD